jgi:hypothetical protein
VQFQDLCRESVGGARQILDLAEGSLQAVNLRDGEDLCPKPVERTFIIYAVLFRSIHCESARPAHKRLDRHFRQDPPRL